MCPFCGNSIIITDEGAKCDRCGERYHFSDQGQLNLKLAKRRQYPLTFELGEELLPQKGFNFGVLKRNDNPEVDFSGMKVPSHLNRELLSYFPKGNGNDSIMLDLGCGTTIHREACEHAGFVYVGADYNSPNAQILLDAHSLPFKDNSFDFVLSVAVLEHIRYPFIMMKEVFRVLKPGGKFIGTVSFLEPFHGNSFYHHTHLGTCNSLKFGGFDIIHISPNPTWSVLKAQASMSLFPKMPSGVSRLVVSPLHYFHRFWWKLARMVSGSAKASEIMRLLKTTGAFSYIAEKNND